MPRIMPIAIPTPATTIVAMIIPPIIVISPYLSALNPVNAIAISPDVRSTKGMPLKGAGMSVYSIFSRSPARITMAIVKPIAVAKPVIVLSSIV